MTTPDHHVARLRLDIQVLRAVAVGVVLLYHLWPNRFPGGFIGVDVFFVISGVLITSHLLREAEGRGIRLGRFWANRMRRLLPLAFVVLIVTAVASLAVAPASQLPAIMRHILGSTFYVENWLLAGDAVDYLARDQAPLPTQHFWSLSVEEQFYIVWPVLLVVTAMIGLRLARRSCLERRIVVRRAAAVALVVVALVSFVHGVVLTEVDPGPAYFATTTRAWQFAVGGLLAFVIDRSATAPTTTRGLVVRTALSWAGTIVLAATVLLLTTAEPYPGVAALLPVVGAVLFLLGGAVDRWFAPSALARVRPVTWLGDVSYGVYLWHWPLIVLVPVALAAPLGTWTKVAIAAAAVLLAWGSKVLIEDPFRFGRRWRARTWRGFAIGVVGSLLVAAIPTTTLAVLDGQRAAEEQAIDDAVDAGLGAEPTDPDAPLVPSIATRVDDRDIMYDCFDRTYEGLRACEYGAEDPTMRVALIGDSHGAHLVPGLVRAFEEQGWSLTTFVGMNCDGAVQPACAGGAAVVDRLTAGGEFDLIIAAGYRGSESTEQVVVDSWDALRAGPTPVLLVGDVPLHPVSTYACIDASGDDPIAAASCTTPVSEALDAEPDRALAYAQRTGADVIDLAPLLCDDVECQSVVGNVVVYQDAPSSHVTGTFSLLLDDVWVQALLPYVP